MRRMRVRWADPDEFMDAARALEGARESNSSFRTIENDVVHGKIIDRFRWDDSTLSIELQGGGFLNCTGGQGRVQASLDRVAAQGVGREHGVVILETESGSTTWNRMDIAARFEGHELDRLWFSRTNLWIYTENGILDCALMFHEQDGHEGLFWM